jgi:pantoate--beta-alanine ligase
MGNLHPGHLSLVEHARSVADRVIVTIFVNPMQFDSPADLATYPRTLADDLKNLSGAGVDLVFCPDMHELYPRGVALCTRVEVPGLSDILEGVHRPGHFAGVATVVTLLLNLIRPQVAVFGEKDFQQLLIIRRLVDDLALGVEIVGRPTLREPDGLAMSSRNSRLSIHERGLAPRLWSVLESVALELQGGEADYAAVEVKACQQLELAGFRPDYVALRQELDLAQVQERGAPVRILAAAWLGHTRLIDNLRVDC